MQVHTCPKLTWPSSKRFSGITILSLSRQYSKFALRLCRFLAKVGGSGIGPGAFLSLEHGLTMLSRFRTAGNFRLELPGQTRGGKSTADGFQMARWNAWSEWRSQKRITSRLATRFPWPSVMSPRLPLHSKSWAYSIRAVQRTSPL